MTVPVMETKRSREDEGDDFPEAKKVCAELIRLLDDSDNKDGDLSSVSTSAEENSAEEDVVAGVMRSLEEEILLAPSVSAETSVSEKESDVPAIDSCSNSTFDRLMDEDGFLTIFPDDLLTEMDFPERRSGQQEPCQVPEGEPGEGGAFMSGSPLGYLLEASDDELGLPPAGPGGQESPRSPANEYPAAGLAVDNWQFDEAFQTMRVPGLQFCEADDVREEAEDGCGFGELFDHSDVADGSFVAFGGNSFS